MDTTILATDSGIGCLVKSVDTLRVGKMGIINDYKDGRPRGPIRHHIIVARAGRDHLKVTLNSSGSIHLV